MRSLIIATLLLTACGADGGGAIDAAGPVPDADPHEPDGGGFPSEDVRGEIELVETNMDAYGPGSRLTARFYAERAPRWHQVVDAEGDCELLRFEQAICDPACTDGLCVAPDMCEPWPDFVSAGTMTITGLTGGSPLVIEPDALGGYYPSEQLPAELFDEGTNVVASIEGGSGIPAASLSTTGVAVVRDPLPNDELPLPNGQDVTVAWTPSGAGGDRVRLTLNANNQGHGAPYDAIIRCDVPDADGDITVPAALVDQFEETSRWEICAGSDCPLSTLVRYRTDELDVDGGVVRLVVGSGIDLWVIHDVP